MASRLVHAVHSLIAFGLPYEHIHARKDSFSQRRPGGRHRAVRHRKYQQLGSEWDFADAYTPDWQHRLERIGRWKGTALAEAYQVSTAHDLDDKVWDFEDRARSERAAVRKYWEGVCAWLVLNPEILKTWGGVDVVAGRIHRVIDGAEVWEPEPGLSAAYASLRRHVEFLLRVDRRLREALQACGG